MTDRIPSFIRFINKSRLYYIVNIIGLSMSGAIMLVAFLFVYRELSTDRFHKNIENIYCIEVDGRARTPFDFAEQLKNQLPGVADFTRVQLWDLKFNVLRFENDPPVDLDRIIRADTNFFSFFSFNVVSGDPYSCLTKPESLVLTESSAVKLFGSGDPIGKTVSYNKGQVLLTVTAVVKDPPFNSSLDFNAVMSVNSLPVIYPPYRQPGAFFWSFETFVRLNGIVPDEHINSTASEIFITTIPTEAVKEAQDIFQSKFQLRMIPYNKVYFNPDFQTSMRKGDIKQVYLFSLIGFLVILVAIVNYINLSNAAATMRTREAVVRKIMGATWTVLFKKFIFESVVICFAAVFISLALGNLLTGIVNRHGFLSLPLEFFNNRDKLLILIAGSLLIGFAGGIYPSVKLASVSPSSSHQHFMISRGVYLRKILLTFQFFVSACMIISAVVVSGQYREMMEQPTGFDAENILYMRMGNELKKNYSAFTDRLRQIPQVEKIANARYPFIGGRNPQKHDFISSGNDASLDAIAFTTDTGFMEMLGLKMAEGNSFMVHDNISRKLIINETALKMMGRNGNFSDIDLPDKVHGVTWHVVGIVKDFNTRSMQYPVCPYVFYHVPGDPDMDGLYIRLISSENIDKTYDMIMKTAMEFSPGEPVKIDFLNDARMMIYRADSNRRKIFLFFSLFTLIISCMGLYALSGLILTRRTKESGIRKVYGADNKSVFFLLSRELIIIVLIACLFAVPLSFYLMNKWLQDFAVKTRLSVFIFLFACAAILIIALLTVTVEIRKLSSTNVADILKYE